MQYNDNFLATGKQVFNKTCARWSHNNRGYGASSFSNPKASYDYLSSMVLKFAKCKSNRCLTCPNANNDNISIDCNPNKEFCKVYNCVYEIQCGECPMKYVGQTSNPLHLRINVHRDQIKKNKCTNLDNQVEYEHFKVHDFQTATLSILCIEKEAKQRLYIENIFMSLKGSIYPYGLNQLHHQVNVFNNFNKKKYKNNIYELFPKQKNINKRFKRGNKKHQYTETNMTTIKNDITNLETGFHDFDTKKVKNFIFALKKNQVQIVNNLLNKDDHNNQFHHLVKDLISYRASCMGFYTKNVIKHNKTNYCVFNFTNKCINGININYIFNQYSHLYPIQKVKVKRAFKYNNSIGRKVYNYNNISKNFKGTPKEIENATCICNNPIYINYIDKECGHILTGNMDIVENNHLQRIMKLGTKYRTQKLFNIRDILNSLLIDLDQFIYNKSMAYKIPTEFFIEWKYNVYNDIKHKMKKPNKIEKVNNKQLQQNIQSLQDKFVITYVDKTSGNFAIVCKKFYMQNLIIAFTKNETFQKINYNGVVLSKKIIALYKKINQKHDNINIPYMVLIPKLHKTPKSFRTVTMGYKTYNSKASKLLLEELKKIENYIIQNKQYLFVKNSFELKQILLTYSGITSLETLDFKDMFNNIQQQQIFVVIMEVYKEFKNVIQFSFDELKFQYLLKQVIFNNYVKFGNEYFNQNVGLPQGLPSSNSAANIYLYYYENKFWSNNNQNTKIFRFIDDLLKVNFSQQILSIDFYPSNLQLIPTNNSNGNYTFLDLSIKICNNLLLFDINKKQQQLNFKVIEMQNYGSNLHFSVYKNILFNNLIRITKLCTTNKYANYNEICNKALEYKYPYKLISELYKKAILFVP